MEKNKIIELLKKKEIRITENRISIISCLSDNNNFHTVSEIKKHITNNLNTKSIYNNLKTLLESGIVKTYSFRGIPKFTVADEYKDVHNSIHIVSKDNVKHLNVDQSIFNNIEEKVKKEGYNPKSINIFIDIEE